MKYWFRKL